MESDKDLRVEMKETERWTIELHNQRSVQDVLINSKHDLFNIPGLFKTFLRLLILSRHENHLACFITLSHTTKASRRFLI